LIKSADIKKPREDIPGDVPYVWGMVDKFGAPKKSSGLIYIHEAP